MNEYKFDSIAVGDNECFEVTISEDKMSLFKDISGDINPMHIDDNYAQKHGYSSRLVYGMLTASFYSTLVGVYLPGRFCILKSVESGFERPVYLGDRLTVSGRVIEKDERFQQLTIKARIVNQEGKTVSKAKILVGFYE